MPTASLELSRSQRDDHSLAIASIYSSMLPLPGCLLENRKMNMLARGAGVVRSCTANAHTGLLCPVPQCGGKQSRLYRESVGCKLLHPRKYRYGAPAGCMVQSSLLLICLSALRVFPSPRWHYHLRQPRMVSSADMATSLKNSLPGILYKI